MPIWMWLGFLSVWVLGTLMVFYLSKRRAFVWIAMILVLEFNIYPIVELTRVIFAWSTLYDGSLMHMAQELRCELVLMWALFLLNFPMVFYLCRTTSPTR